MIENYMNMNKQRISLKEDGDKRILKNIKKQKEEKLKIIEKQYWKSVRINNIYWQFVI